MQDIIVFLTWKVFDSNYFLNIVSKGDMREVVNKESQMNTIIFQIKIMDMSCILYRIKVLKGTVVNRAFLSIKGRSI